MLYQSIRKAEIASILASLRSGLLYIPAIYILNASRIMKIRVLDVMHLPGIEEDNLIYGVIVDHIETVFPFLNMSDI